MNTILNSRRSRENHDRAIPILLSFGMHIILALAVVFWPGLFASRPILPQGYTVNYISLSSQTPNIVPMQGKPGTSSKKIEPTKPTEKVKSAEIKNKEPILEKTPISIPPAIEVTKEKVHPERAIDQKPIKNRIENPTVNKLSINQRIHELEEKHEQLAERERQAEQIRRQQIAESARAEQEAKKAANEVMINQKVHELQEKQKHEQMVERERQAEQIRRQKIAESAREQQEAEQEANEATEELNELLRLPNSTTNGTNDSQKNENKDKEIESNQNPIEKGYLASISSRIQQFWALPEFEKWDPSLMATIVITINQDGRIISQSFQEHSKNKLFDQYVEKTLQRAAPLPPIPAALKKSQFEIGLFFKPTGLQSKK